MDKHSWDYRVFLTRVLTGRLLFRALVGLTFLGLLPLTASDGPDPDHRLRVLSTSAAFKDAEAFLAGVYVTPEDAPAVAVAEHTLGSAYTRLLMRTSEGGGYNLLAATADGPEVLLHSLGTTDAFTHEEVAVHNGEAVYVIDVDTAPDGRLIFNAIRGTTEMDFALDDCRLGRNKINCCEVDTGRNNLTIKARAFCLDFGRMNAHTTRIESETDPVFGNYIPADEEQTATVAGVPFKLRPHIPNGSRMDISGDLILVGPEGGHIYLNYLDIEIDSGLSVNITFNPAGYFEPLSRLGFLHMSSCHIKMVGSMFANAETRELMQMGDTREHRGSGGVSHVNFAIARPPYLEIGGQSHMLAGTFAFGSEDGRLPNGHDGAPCGIKPERIAHTGVLNSNPYQRQIP
ncbi:MAG: hypothetical protein H6849_00935 [Alphaproteobacteria bacterium]|nr:MAG: hypothetical protein H6849_00935 [Alphaproteobacteria bacterium]